MDSSAAASSAVAAAAAASASAASAAAAAAAEAQALQAAMEAAIQQIKNLLSPLLILVCIAFIFFGIFSAQVYSYWFAYEYDGTVLRTFVAVLWGLELFHTIFCFHMLYTYFVGDIGAPINAATIECARFDLCGGDYSGLIARILHPSSLGIESQELAILLLARVATSFATAVFLVKFPAWAQFHAELSSKTTTDVGLVLAALVDIIVTCLLAFYLRQQKSAFRRTQHMMQRMMFYTINTGAVTMCCSIAALFMFNLIPTSLLFGGMVELQSKLYANSVLAMLNMRKHLRTKIGESSNSIPLHFTSQESRGTTDVINTSSLRIDIHKDVVNDREANPIKSEL
ncbi:uncharacterized protein PHACADRAFT_210246 [Phanerochaete carnosa HHB-10118-sp]|uniref:DUF6534 domain-containing protein n=1 Tax=Phanerochaete carnosa (strain HHB-10118-sp) TaxID=650164 RepID=K5WVI2_PHACS|nr:uncharacterized protein PHACADRAFT_210246 [Phanerochaete carnosa HHB-10118-sp]EKM54447.1 hypothetical protein PHACADRAFT_210246 [Phanerochaete carnosa HHB-10118-sp]